MMRTAILIDGLHIYAMGRCLELDLDYSRWIAYFRLRSQVLRHYYFTAVRTIEGTQTIRPLLDYLTYNGFTVIEKPAKEYVDELGRPKVKSNMAVEIAVTAFRLAQAKAVDEIVLVVNDDEYIALIKALMDTGIIVTLVSTKTECSAKVSDELRRVPDHFIDLADLKEVLRKEKN